MLIIKRTEMRDAPLFVCAVCGERIKNAGMGMVALEEVPVEHEGEVQFTFPHKGECDERFKGGHMRRGGWVELTHFLADLLYNSGLETPEQVNAAITSRDKIRETLG